MKFQDIQKWNIRLVRSYRRTIALQIERDLRLTVRAPYGMTEEQICRFIEEKSGWIEKHMQGMREKREALEARQVEPISAAELRHLAEEALSYISERVDYFARQMQVSYGRITIRNQKTRWGSCSSRGNLNFNCLLMRTPPEVIDYVVVHELCHRKEMNHSARFWAEVEQVLPDYRTAKMWLKDQGQVLFSSIVWYDNSNK